MQTHFIEAFSLAVKQHADKPALYFGKKSFNYQELDILSDKIANDILKFRLAKETIIPMVLERTPHLIITMLGILKSGCAFLPISPASPCSRIEYILDDIKTPLLFCDSPMRFKLPEGTTNLVPEDSYSNQEKIDHELRHEGKELAYVMYTSGSTGKPKGVLIEHQSMMNLFYSLIETLTLSHQDLFLALTDYTFDISLIELLMPLILGASIVLTEHGAVADGKKIKHYLKKFDVSFMQATPLTWEILLKNGWKNNGTTRLLVGGEKFKTSLALKLQYEKGNIWNVYGPTETSMWSMIYHLKTPLTTESVPLGHPLANTTLKLLNEGDSNQAELYIGGLGVARGYLNAKELTESKFVYDEESCDRLYKTGDLVIKTEDEALCYVGRIDDQLKFGGIRIEAGEIEATIEQESFVKKAVVKMHEHHDYYKTLAAYIEIDEETFFSQDTHSISHDSSLYMEKIYDEAYSHAKEFENGLINTCGWQSSFTGKTFEAPELKETYTQIQRTILNADLTHVLEVGCGTGSLLLDYLAKAQQATVAEISHTAIDYVQSIVPKAHLPKVTFKLESIINIHEINRYSCIVVNSVIQYLPSIKSLVDSLKQLIKATKPGGTVLIGDVRSLELLDVFLTIKHSCHHPEKIEICPTHLFYKSRDTEIVLSPLFFYALKEQVKRISWVDINVKHGDYLNELNYFRYDVVLHIEKEVTPIDCHTLAYHELQDEKDLSTFTNQPLKAIKIQNIPYDYLDSLCQQLSVYGKNYLDNLLKGARHDLDEPKKKLASSLIRNSLDGYEAFVHYQTNAPHAYLQLLLVPQSNTKSLLRPIEKEKIDSFHAYCREPFSPWVQEFCFDHIRMNIKKHVMTWVNPSIYIWVEKWPQTINGKLDKNKLSLPIAYTNNQDKGSVLSQLKQMWLNITGDNALISEEFWTHGVSSLSMYYFLATINEKFHLDMTYHEFHQHNTMEKVAAYIERLLKSSLENEAIRSFDG